MKTTTDREGQARKLAAKQLATDMLGQPCRAPLLNHVIIAMKKPRMCSYNKIIESA